jgi:hypothetical protein
MSPLEALLGVLLGLAVVAFAITPDLQQGFGLGITLLASRISPQSAPRRILVSREPSWWLAALGAAFIAATLVAYFLPNAGNPFFAHLFPFAIG